jgi:hypothetical protein
MKKDGRRQKDQNVGTRLNPLIFHIFSTSFIEYFSNYIEKSFSFITEKKKVKP